MDLIATTDGPGWAIAASLGTVLAAIAAAAAAGAALHQGRLASRALKASILPLLVAMPSTETSRQTLRMSGGPEIEVQAGQVLVEHPPRHIRVSVPFQNIGNGVAFLRGVGLLTDEQLPYESALTASVIPPGGSARANFVLDLGRSEVMDRATAVGAMLRKSFSVELAYTDASGQQWEYSRLDIHYKSTGEAWARQTFLYRGSQGKRDAEPYAASGPGGD